MLGPCAGPGGKGWSWILSLGAGVWDWGVVLASRPGRVAEAWEVFLGPQLVLESEAGSWSWSL